jgi:hypothetical protein
VACALLSLSRAQLDGWKCQIFEYKERCAYWHTASTSSTSKEISFTKEDVSQIDQDVLR